MTDTPPEGARAARRAEPSGQTLALTILGGGSLALLAGIVAIRAFFKLEAEAALLITVIAQGLLGFIATIAGFYFGAGLHVPKPPAAPDARR